MFPPPANRILIIVFQLCTIVHLVYLITGGVDTLWCTLYPENIRMYLGFTGDLAVKEWGEYSNDVCAVG